MGFLLMVMVRLMDHLTDQQVNWIMYRWKGIIIWTFWKFHPAILMGIFTMNLTDCSTDGMDDRHNDRWTDFQVESHFC